MACQQRIWSRFSASSGRSPDRSTGWPTGSPASPRSRCRALPTRDSPTRITADVAAVPGVATAAPMIRTSASSASGPVLLLGADASTAALGGALERCRIEHDRRRRCPSTPNGVQVGPGVGSCERRDVPAGLGFGHRHRGARGQATCGSQRRTLRSCATCLGAEHYRPAWSARLDTDHHETGRRSRRGSRRGHRRGERPRHRRRPEHASHSGRRRCQADELHGPDGRDGCFGGRRVPDLHHDDDGDHPAPAGHLDAARDRRPTRHHRSRHARGGGDPRTDRRSHRVGHRNTRGPHCDWSIASGHDPRARSSRRVLAARLRDTGRRRGDRRSPVWSRRRWLRGRCTRFHRSRHWHLSGFQRRIACRAGCGSQAGLVPSRCSRCRS